MSGTSETFTRAGSDRANKLWSIVLAGGEGLRLLPLIRHLYGEDRPKQYSSLLGSRSLLRATLDRIARKVPLEKTLVVTSRWHSKYAKEEFGSAAKVKLFVQPRDRGTAAGVLFPVHWIRGQDPDAVVAVFPSDHFIADEGAFMDHVEKLAVLAGRHADRIFLVGARPTAPDVGYGWIEPSERMDGAGLIGVSGVRRFWEKPSGEIARFCFDRGYLWNTFVMVGRASVFLEAAGAIFRNSTDGLLAPRLSSARSESPEWWTARTPPPPERISPARFSRSTLPWQSRSSRPSGGAIGEPRSGSSGA